MKKKISGIIITTLLIATMVLLVVGTINIDKIQELQKNFSKNISINEEKYQTDIFFDELDQWQTEVYQGDACHYIWDEHNVPNNKMSLAQSFKPTLPTLTRVELYLLKAGNPIYGYLKIMIKDQIDSGSPLTSKILTSSDVPAGATWVTVDFPDISVTPEKTYYIVVDPYNVTNNAANLPYLGWFYGSDIDDTLYFRGMGYRNDYYIQQGWKPEIDIDYCFKTYGIRQQTGVDLYIESRWRDQGEFTVGDTMNLFANICNKGTVASSSSTVQFSISMFYSIFNKNLLVPCGKPVTLGEILPGECTIARVPWPIPYGAAGHHCLKVEVIENTDVDLSNNVAWLNVDIYQYPDLPTIPILNYFSVKTTFHLTVTEIDLPSGWSSYCSPSTLTLQPNAEGTITVYFNHPSVIPPGTRGEVELSAFNGSYDFLGSTTIRFIYDENPPVVHIIRPKAGYFYVNDRELFRLSWLDHAVVLGPITIAAFVQDEDVDKVEFYVGDTIVNAQDGHGSGNYEYFLNVYAMRTNPIIKVVGRDFAYNSGYAEVETFMYNPMGP